jgi:hypothetical protein
MIPSAGSTSKQWYAALFCGRQIDRAWQRSFLPQWTLRRILAVQVVDRYAARDRGALQPFGMAKRAQSIFIARIPTLAHRGAGQFLISRVAVVIFVLIDEMHDVDDSGVRTFGADLLPTAAE